MANVFYFGTNEFPSEPTAFYIYSGDTDGSIILGKSAIGGVAVLANGYILSGGNYVQAIRYTTYSDSNGAVHFPKADEWIWAHATLPKEEVKQIQKLSISFTYLGKTYSFSTTGSYCYLLSSHDTYVGPKDTDGVLDTWTIEPTFKNSPIPNNSTSYFGTILASGKCKDNTIISGKAFFAITSANTTAGAVIRTYKTFPVTWTSGNGTNFTKWTSAYTITPWPSIPVVGRLTGSILSTASESQVLGAASSSPYYVTAITATVQSDTLNTQSWESVENRRTIDGTESNSLTTNVSLTNLAIPQTFTRTGVTFKNATGTMDATGGKWKIYNTLSSARTDNENCIWSGWVTTMINHSFDITISGNTNASISVERDGFETYNMDASSLNTSAGLMYPWEATVMLNKDEDNPKLATINNFRSGSSWSAFAQSIMSTDIDYKDRVMTYATSVDEQKQFPPLSGNNYFRFLTPSYSGESEDYEWEHENGLEMNSGKVLSDTCHSMRVSCTAPRAIKSSDILKTYGTGYPYTQFASLSNINNGAVLCGGTRIISPKGIVNAKFAFNGEETSAVPYNWSVSGVATSGYVYASTLPYAYVNVASAGKWTIQFTDNNTMTGGITGAPMVGAGGFSGNDAYWKVACSTETTSATTKDRTFVVARDGVSDSVTVQQAVMPSISLSGDNGLDDSLPLFSFDWDEFGSECAHTATVKLNGAISWKAENTNSNRTNTTIDIDGKKITSYWAEKPLAGDGPHTSVCLKPRIIAYDKWGNSVEKIYHSPQIRASLNAVPTASGCAISAITESALTFLATDTTAKIFVVGLNNNKTYSTNLSGSCICESSNSNLKVDFFRSSSTTQYYAVRWKIHWTSKNTGTEDRTATVKFTPISRYKYHDGTYISGVSTSITVTQVAGGEGSSSS